MGRTDLLLTSAILGGAFLFFILPSYAKADDAERASELHGILARGGMLTPEEEVWLDAYDRRAGWP